MQVKQHDEDTFIKAVRDNWPIFGFAANDDDYYEGNLELGDVYVAKIDMLPYDYDPDALAGDVLLEVLRERELEELPADAHFGPLSLDEMAQVLEEELGLGPQYIADVLAARSEYVFDEALDQTILGPLGGRSLDEYAANPGDSEVTRAYYQAAVAAAREDDRVECLVQLQLAQESVPGLIV